MLGHQTMQDTIIVRLGASRLAAAAIVMLAGATLALVALVPAPAWARACLVLAVGGAMLRHYRFHALRNSPRSVRAFRIARDGSLEVEEAAGCRRGALRAGGFVAPFLTIVCWRPDGARFDRRIVIFPDMLPPETFRALRLLLRWS